MKTHRPHRWLRRLLAVATLGCLAGVTAAAAATLEIDIEHSTVGFSVRHLFTRVQGRFGEFEGTLEFDPNNLKASKVSVTIRTASVDTDVEARDKDLRSSRFFDVESFPTLEFTSTSIDGVSGDRFKIRGHLTMHGVRKQVVLDAEFLGMGKDPWGNERYGFHASTTVSRKDYGMQWNEVLETGGLLVGDEVEIRLDIEAMPAAP